jgi:hypothetical protein
MTQSGAAFYMGLPNGPLYLLGMGALSKLLNSPRGVRALTKAVTLPIPKVNAGAAAGSAAATEAVKQILAIAGEDARPYVLPKAASNEETEAPEEQLAGILP